MASKKFKKKLELWRGRKSEMASMRSQGMTLKAIGEKFKVTKQRVKQILDKVVKA